jgi:hypothetical protein
MYTYILQHTKKQGLCVTDLIGTPQGEYFNERILELHTGIPSLTSGVLADSASLFSKFSIGDMVLVTPGRNSPLGQKVASVEGTVVERGPNFLQVSVTAWPQVSTVSVCIIMPKHTCVRIYMHTNELGKRNCV